MEVDINRQDTMKYKGVGALLPAAGMSKRMGDFKPLLPYKSSTIAAHVIAMLKELGISPIVVVTGNRADELENHIINNIDDGDVIFVRNASYMTSQMFDSVKIGLEAIKGKCERILMMPIDYPAIKKDTYEKLLSHKAPLVRPICNERHGHPLIIEETLLDYLIKYNGEGGIKGAAKTLGIDFADVSVDDPGVYMDVDTPAEYASLLKM